MIKMFDIDHISLRFASTIWKPKKKNDITSSKSLKEFLLLCNQFFKLAVDVQKPNLLLPILAHFDLVHQLADPTFNPIWSKRCENCSQNKSTRNLFFSITVRLFCLAWRYIKVVHIPTRIFLINLHQRWD